MKKILMAGAISLALIGGGCGTTSVYSSHGTQTTSVSVQKNLFQAQTAFGITLNAVNVAVSSGKLKGANATDAMAALTAAKTALELASAALITSDPVEAQAKVNDANKSMAAAKGLALNGGNV